MPAVLQATCVCLLQNPRAKLCHCRCKDTGLCLADFNQAEFTIQLGPFQTQEVDLEELL